MRAARVAAVAALLAGVVLTGANPAADAATAAVPTAVPAAVPATDAVTVTLAGPVDPPAPDARTVATITVPLTITNTTDDTLYDVRVQALRSAPITSAGTLDAAFGGAAVQPGDTTQGGPALDLDGPLAPGAQQTVDYTVDSSSDRRTGICLCFLGVYAVDLDVTAADDEGGRRGPVGRVQTYLPSLTADQTVRGSVGWLWPLLDRPHREVEGTAFTDDDLATSVSPGGRLDRALRAVEDVDAADPTGAVRMLLVLDPETLAELATMTRGYSVAPAGGGATVSGTGGPAAARWLARLAAVLPRHDARFTPPADPDVTALTARGIVPSPTLTAVASAQVAAALGLTPATLPAHDLGWPAAGVLDRAGLDALVAAGTTDVVTSAVTGTDGSVASLRGGVHALVADPTVQEQARDAVSTGTGADAALQRLVAATAISGVESPDTSTFVLVVPDRDTDVDPAAAARAVLATSGLGTPESPVAALARGGPEREDLVGSGPPATGVLGPALDAAAAAAGAADTLRSAVVDGDTVAVLGDLPGRIQRATSNGWSLDPTVAGRYTADLVARTRAVTDAVQVVVGSEGSYSLASEDAPLLVTVANDLPVAVRVRVDIATAGGLSGFRAGSGEFVTLQPGSRPTLRIPTTVARTGRFDVVVTLHSGSGAVVGTPARLTVNSSAVGVVGQIVTYGAGILLVLALVVRGVRRWRQRSRAGSTG